MNDELTSIEYWEDFWSSIKLPVLANPDTQVTALLKTYLPDISGINLFEVGCAPGGWMAYFNKKFGYNVTGIEYAQVAANATIKNLETQKVDANILVEDFFKINNDICYDVIFSRGFIEHFENTQEVVNKISKLSSNTVLTIIPNLFGINGLISRVFRPDVYKKHILITRTQLKQFHELAGLKTVYCNYSNEFRIIQPFEKNKFSKHYPRITKLLNSPVWLLNKIANTLFSVLSSYPSTKMFSPSIIYIGKK
ncbi:MAG: class I SAM-dependent methyltransferase [Reichenbachiella sp.]